jgi:replicative DNA helicase
METPNRKKKRNNASEGEARQRASADLVRKLPPQNLEAEQAVLGGVFLSKDLFHSLVDIVSPDDFHTPGNATIFQTFIDLYEKNQPIDLVTVSNALSTTEKLDEVGGPVYLAELADSVVSASNALHHAHIVREKSILRQLIDTSSGIIADCYSSLDVDALLDEAEKKIFEIADGKSGQTVSSSRELVKEVFDELTIRFTNKSAVTGIRTGYSKFDEMTAGLQNSDLVIVAGRPSMGKTAFALNLAIRAAVRENVPTAIFSLEMSKEQLMTRLLAVQGHVDLGHLRTGFIDDDEWSKLRDAAHDLSEAQIFIDDTPALTPLEMRARCRRLKSQFNLGLVMVDYLQLMRVKGRTDSREQEISEISRSLKALAKELHIPVIALSQLNRKVEERNPPRPKMQDLRESGAIEQDADMILFLYRDDFYNQAEDNPKRNTAEVIIGKQRNGPIGDVDLRFFKHQTRFEDLNLAPEPSEHAFS